MAQKVSKYVVEFLSSGAANLIVDLQNVQNKIKELGSDKVSTNTTNIFKEMENEVATLATKSNITAQEVQNLMSKMREAFNDDDFIQGIKQADNQLNINLQTIAKYNKEITALQTSIDKIKNTPVSSKTGKINGYKGIFGSYDYFSKGLQSLDIDIAKQGFSTEFSKYSVEDWEGLEKYINSVIKAKDATEDFKSKILETITAYKQYAEANRDDAADSIEPKTKKIGELNKEIEKLQDENKELEQRVVLLEQINGIEKDITNTNNGRSSKLNSEAAKDTQIKIEEIAGDKKTAEDYAGSLINLAVVYRTLKSIVSEVFTVTKELDAAFNEIATVTQYTTSQVWDMYDSFLAIANETGATSKDIIQVVGEYTKQGKSMTESLELTRAAAVSAKIAGIDVMDSVRYLTAALNGYNLAASEAMNVSDKFAKLAAVSATDYADLAVALTKVAAQASVAGVNMDNLLGMMTMALEVTQEAPENIGTAFKTILARMSEIKDYGAVLEDNTTANQVSKALNSIGVSLFDTTGEMRALDDVLIDVGYKWDSLNSVQQKYITTALAGSRQQTRLVSIFQDFDKTLKYMKDSADSAGSALSQQAKRMEGMAYSLERLNNAKEAFITSLSTSEVIIGIIDKITNLVNALSKISVPLMTLVGVLGTITAIGSAQSGFLGKILTGLTGNYTKGLSKIVDVLSAIGTEGTSLVALIGKNLSTAFSSFTKAVTSATSASGGLATVLTGLGKVALIIGGIAALIAIIDKLTVSYKELTEQARESYAAIYQSKDDYSNLEDLIDEYDELYNKIGKTADEVERLKSIQQEVKELTGMNLFDNDGDLNSYNVDRAKQNIIDEINAEYDEYEKIREQYGKDSGSILNNEEADDYIKSMEKSLMVYEAIRKSSEDEWETRKEIVAAIINGNTALEKTASLAEDITDIINNMSGYGGIVSDEVAEAAGGDASGRYRLRNFGYQGEKWVDVGDFTALTGLTDSDENRSAFIAALLGSDFDQPMEEWFKGFKDELEKKTQEKLSNFDIGDLLNNSFGTDILRAIGKGLIVDLNQLGFAITDAEELIKNFGTTNVSTWTSIANILDLSSEQTEEFFKVISSGEGTIEDLTKASLKYADSLEDVIAVNRAITNTAADFTPALNGLKSLTGQVNGLEKAFSSLDFDSIYSQLMNLSDDIQQVIMNELTTTGEISEATANKMVEDYKEQALKKIDIQIQEEEAILASLQSQLDAVEASTQATIELNLEEFNNEILIGNQSIQSEKDIADQKLEIYTDYVNQKITLEKKAAEEIANETYNLLGTVSVKGTDGITYNKIEYTKDAAKATLTSLIEESTTRLNALKLLREGILKNVYNPKNTAYSSSSSGASDATEAAEEYARALDNLYNVMRKLDKMSSKLSLTTALQSLYENRDGASYRAMLDKEAEYLQAQIDLLEEHNKAILAEQRYLKANLSAEAATALQVDEMGYLNVNMEKYAKLSDAAAEELDDFIDAFDELTDTMWKNQQSIIDNMAAIEEYKEKLRDSRISLENELKDGVIKIMQELYDEQVKILEDEKKLSEKRKEIYQDVWDAEDYENELADIESQRSDIRAQIAALSGATDTKSVKKRTELMSKLTDLDTSYNQKVQENYRNALLQQETDLQTSLDERTTALEDEQQGIAKNTEFIEKYIEALYSGNTQDLMAFVEKNGQQFVQLINQMGDLGINFTTEIVNTMGAITEDGMTNVVEFLKSTNDAYAEALSLEKEKLEQEWTSLYETIFGDAAKSKGEEYWNSMIAKAKEYYDTVSQGSGTTKTTSSSGSSSSGSNKTTIPSSTPSSTPTKTKTVYVFNGVEYSSKESAMKAVNSYVNTAWKYDSVARDRWDHWYGGITGTYNHFANTITTKQKAYKKGGLVDYTGLAMVHGSSSSPEAFLNASQTEMFANLTEALQKMYNNNSNISNATPSIDIESINISTNSLNTAQDFYQGGVQLANGLTDILRQRGIQINKKR